jgi:hypothetical protein
LSKESKEEYERDTLGPLSLLVFFAGLSGSSRWVGENESLNDVAQDGQAVASTGISRWQRGQFIGGGLYQKAVALLLGL